jgi:hypothetical protein
MQRRILNSHAFASGIQLGWETRVPIASVGDSIVATDGTLIEARQLGVSSTNRTVNGVVFSFQLSRDALDGGFSGGTVYNAGGIGADFEAMMDSFSFKNVGDQTAGNLVLIGLTASKTYILQLFIADDRGDNTRNREQQFTIGPHVSDAVKNGDQYSLICYFVASATTQTVGITVSDGAIVLNGFQVRQLD